MCEPENPPTAVDQVIRSRTPQRSRLNARGNIVGKLKHSQIGKSMAGQTNITYPAAPRTPLIGNATQSPPRTPSLSVTTCLHVNKRRASMMTAAPSGVVSSSLAWTAAIHDVDGG